LPRVKKSESVKVSDVHVDPPAEVVDVEDTGLVTVTNPEGKESLKVSYHESSQDRGEEVSAQDGGSGQNGVPMPEPIQVRDSRGQVYEYVPMENKYARNPGDIRYVVKKLGQAYLQKDPETGEEKTYVLRVERPRSKKDRRKAKLGLPYKGKA